MTTIAQVEAQVSALTKSIEEMRGELRAIRAPYKAARERVVELRDAATPLVVALARANVEQGKIADDLGVTRETIRRTEIRYDIDRGDPRADQQMRRTYAEERQRAKQAGVPMPMHESYEVDDEDDETDE